MCELAARLWRALCGGLQAVDYRSKTFSCSQCGSEASLAAIAPIKEAGMQDYRVDAIKRPERHPPAVDWLTGPSGAVDYPGGELPGRKVDGRR